MNIKQELEKMEKELKEMHGNAEDAEDRLFEAWWNFRNRVNDREAD